MSSRLLVGVLAPLLVLWLIVSLMQYGRDRGHAQEAYDRTLLGAVQVIADTLVVVDGAVSAEVPRSALAALAPHADGGVLYRVACAQPPFPIAGYHDLPAAPAPGSPLPTLVDQTYDGARIRMATIRRPVAGAADCAAVDVQIAESTGPRDVFSGRLWLDGVATELALITAAGLLVFAGVRSALLPLHRLAGEVRARQPADLSAIDVRGVPGEVVPLIEAINGLTQRQREAIQANRDFVANASHQLKTPLSVLRPLMDLALRQRTLGETRALLLELRDSTRALERVVHQSLALLRAEPGAALERAPLDLVEAARAATFELLPLALQKSIDLGFAERGAVIVSGHEFLLRELVANLVDNAIRYTPRHGRIGVSVERDGDAWTRLTVQDSGPGIAPDERGRVFERFHRPTGSTGDGCGLGLPIVRQICKQHGGSVELDDAPAGQGLRVTVRLPAR